ncbi:MAG TPA: VTT domain-containing protein [Pilimelia sp.]|nr:VTT domain-containing protein [Pilimelia sp.]
MPAHLRRRALSRMLPLLAAVAALAVAATQLPLAQVRELVAGLGAAAPVVAVALGAALISVLVPRTAISMACGALFGAFAGFWCAVAAAMVAAAGTYVLGRWAGSGLLAARLGGRLHRLDRWLARRGVLAVVVTRLLPLSPFGLVGYAYGTSTVRVRHYLLGTLLGAVPSSVSYATLGAAVVAPGALSPLAVLPAAAGMAISTGAAWHWRRTARAERAAAAAAATPPVAAAPVPAGAPSSPAPPPQPAARGRGGAAPRPRRAPVPATARPVAARA